MNAKQLSEAIIHRDIDLAKEWYKSAIQNPETGDGWRYTCYRLAMEVERLREINEKQNKDENTAFGENVNYVFSKWKECAEKLAEALEFLRDFQNGCPLPKYEANWKKAMEDSLLAIETFNKLKDEK